MASSNVTNLGEFYMEKGRAEVRAALRTWLEAVKGELTKELAKPGPSDPDEYRDRQAELRGGVGIVAVILESMEAKPVA